MVKKKCHCLHCLKFLHKSYRISEWGRIWGWRKRDGCVFRMTQRRKKRSLQPGRGCETRRLAGEKRRDSEALLPPGWNMGEIHWGHHNEDLGARSVVKRVALREQWQCLNMLPSLMISLQLWVRSGRLSSHSLHDSQILAFTNRFFSYQNILIRGFSPTLLVFKTRIFYFALVWTQISEGWIKTRDWRAGFSLPSSAGNKYPQLLPSVMKPHTQLYQCTAILTFKIPRISVHEWMQSQVGHASFKAGHWLVLGPFTTSGKSV